MKDQKGEVDKDVTEVRKCKYEMDMGGFREAEHSQGGRRMKLTPFSPPRLVTQSKLVRALFLDEYRLELTSLVKPLAAVNNLRDIDRKTKGSVWPVWQCWNFQNEMSPSAPSACPLQTRIFTRPSRAEQLQDEMREESFPLSYQPVSQR